MIRWIIIGVPNMVHTGYIWNYIVTIFAEKVDCPQNSYINITKRKFSIGAFGKECRLN